MINQFSYRILDSLYYFSLPFGSVTHPITRDVVYHRGIDIKCVQLTKVITPLSGKVELIRQDSIYGLTLTIAHQNGEKSVFGSLSSCNVQKDQIVVAGQTVAFSGNSGQSTGPHLHYEFVVNGKNKDPFPYLTGEGADTLSNLNISDSEKTITNDALSTEIFSQVVEVKKKTDELAAGIWQIIKVIIDDSLKNERINDYYISFLQGSLFSFFEKVCQKPFVEFFGDTYGDQYYFLIRKPPFTREAYLSLPTVTIKEQYVESNNLGFGQDGIYSWYQLIPAGSYIGNSQTIFQYIPAVFFEEFAEIWGSRPLSVTSNYITFLREDGKVITELLVNQLRFIIEMNAYSAFTREGTITLKGIDRRIKKGIRIYHEPTNEYFYVDSVTNNFSVSQKGEINAVQTIKVSKGMIKEYAENEITSSNSFSYFNIINFGDQKPRNINKVAGSKNKTVHLDSQVCIFNFQETTLDISTTAEYQNQKERLGELLITKSNYDSAFENISNICKALFDNKQLIISLQGGSSGEGTYQQSIDIANSRANSIRETILFECKERYKIDVSKRVLIENSQLSLQLRNTYDKFENRKLRNVTVKVVKGNESSSSSQDASTKKPEVANWKVNKKVFKFFLRNRHGMITKFL